MARIPSQTSGGDRQVEAMMECPFYSAGLFSTEEVDGECADGFMEVASRELPACGEHCCSLRHSSGGRPSRPAAAIPDSAAPRTR